MVLWKPDRGSPDIRGNVTRVTVKCMGPSEKTAFAMCVASIRWEPLLRLTTCEEKYSYYQTIVNSCFPIKTVTRHTADKPWITDLFRNLIRKRQRVYKSGNRNEYRVLLMIGQFYMLRLMTLLLKIAQFYIMRLMAHFQDYAI